MCWHAADGRSAAVQFVTCDLGRGPITVQRSAFLRLACQGLVAVCPVPCHEQLPLDFTSGLRGDVDLQPSRRVKSDDADPRPAARGSSRPHRCNGCRRTSGARAAAASPARPAASHRPATITMHIYTTA